MKKLENKIALITGASDGLGFATAKKFIDEGAYVFITGRRQEELDKAVTILGPNAYGVQGDVSKLTDLDRLFDTIKKEKGHIDILFACAGAGEGAPLGMITEEQFDKTFDTNVKGMLFTVQKALLLLVDNASVILMASTSASKGMFALSMYAAAKSAVRSFARNWTLDLKARGIRVNAISPGASSTPNVSSILDKEENKAIKAHIVSTIPMGRLGDPEETAKAATFLASNDSSYITGIELFVDGGHAQV